MSITVTLDSDLQSAWRECRREIADGMGRAVKKAAEAGAEHSQRSHTYTDRTHDLTRGTQGRLVSSGPEGAEGVLEWDEDYASFVDKGTSRSRAFAFSEEAGQVAEVELTHEMNANVERAISKLGK